MDGGDGREGPARRVDGANGRDGPARKAHRNSRGPVQAPKQRYRYRAVRPAADDGGWTAKSGNVQREACVPT